MPSSFSATANPLPTPPGPVPGIVRVLSLTSLNANATGSSRFANLGYANVTSNVSLSAQNAVSNQQAHSQLNHSVVGRSVNQVSLLGPQEARSSVEVLTGNELAESLADLQSALAAFKPGGTPSSNWQLLVKLARDILAAVIAIELQNARLQGDGTSGDPYHTVGDQLLYVLAPTALVFVDVPPDQLKLHQNIQGTRR